MMTQEHLIDLLRHYPKDETTRNVYREINELYVNEFGLGWVLKEMAEARTIIAKVGSIKKGNWGKVTDKTWQTIDRILKEIDEPKERITRKFIGAKEVNQNDFAIYSKGLYWLAGYDLLNDR